MKLSGHHGLLLALLGSFVVLAVPATSAAHVNPTATSSFSDTRLGAHSDFKIDMSFPVTGAPASSWDETVKDLVVDTPTGFAGNPNAVPYNERCDAAVFETGICPASSQVGRIGIDGGLNDPVDGVYSGINNIANPGQVYLLKDSPEVPAVFGIYIRPAVFVSPLGWPAIKSRISIGPDVASDLKLRTKMVSLIPNTVDTSNVGAGEPAGQPAKQLPNVVRRMVLTFWGKLPNGNAFLTNPTRCEPWTTQLYAQGYVENLNANSDPLGHGVNDFVAAAPSVVTPDCSSTPPFPISGTTKISSQSRDVSPDFDFDITLPGLAAGEIGSSVPKSIVTLVPAAINVDVNQLNRTCARDLFFADACPPATRIGTVKVDTPFIAAGLSGDVYLVRKPTAGLPDLGLQIRGAVHFRQLGSNKYVGPNGNQIQTTFDNIPQLSFSHLNVHLFGGPTGLLRTLACPTSNKQPSDGNFSYAFTSYTGQTTSSTTNLNTKNCFGIQKLKTFGCVYKILRFQPTYTSRARIKQVVLYVDGKKALTAKRVPFQFRLTGKPLKKIKVGKHKYKIKAIYDDKTVSVKQATFKRCGARGKKK